MKDNTKIIELFLEKLEKLTDDERKELLKTIRVLNNPIFVIPS